MVGIAEISAGLGSLKAAMDVVKGIDATRSADSVRDTKVALQDLIIDARQSLMSAQEAHAADLNRIDEMKAEIVRLKDWSAERANYRLCAVDVGAFAYAPKPEIETAEPAHWLCAPCFDETKKSILQRKRVDDRHPAYSDWFCPTCKATIAVGYGKHPGGIA